MKKILSIGLAAIMSLGILSGCGEKKETSNVTTVTVWTGNTHSKTVVTKLVEAYNKTTGADKGIKIDYQVKGGDSYSQTIDLALESGTAPDLFEGGDIKKLAASEAILAIDDVTGGDEYLKRYEGFLSVGRTTYNNKTYKVPVGSTTQGIIYNKDMFKAAGLVDENGEAKAPETFAEMREYAKKLTNAEKKEFGIIYPKKWDNWQSSDMGSLLMSNQGRAEYNPGSGKYEYDGYKPIYEMIIGMKKDGSVYPGEDSMDNDSARALFAEGGIGMKFAYSFDVGVLNDQFPAKCDWGVAPYPVEKIEEKYKQRADYSYSLFMNGKSAVEPEKLLEVLKFFTSDDFMREMYKEGMTIPYTYDIIKDIKLDNAKKGWEEFSALADISELPYRAPKSTLAGMKSPSSIFLEDIWTGKISIDEGIRQMNETIEKAVNNYYTDNPEENRKEFMIENWAPSKRD